MGGQATRAQALAQLHEFLPRVPAYAAGRGYVRARYREVSLLAPFIRHRLISEEEIVRTVLSHYPFERAEKYVQEVVWRTYWKGWLEHRPEVWTSCLVNERRYRDEAATAPWGERYENACRGETALPYFNAWVHELKTTGYLHNHVRMWFASIWVFTLALPWQLGAMFMYRHLLDGDPASNTLSWRWVTGLQTKGKRYLARPENIATYSDGRWQPEAGELNEHPGEIESVETHTPTTPLPPPTQLPAGEYGVLTTSDDLSVECQPDIAARARLYAVLRHRSILGEASHVDEFIAGAEMDALTRIGERGVAVESSAQLTQKLRDLGLTTLVVITPSVGPEVAPTAQLVAALEADGVRCVHYRRRWDTELYALADRGFFPFWERVKKTHLVPLSEVRRKAEVANR
jgi:deoxyribodipyrimidine photo-lyase